MVTPILTIASNSLKITQVTCFKIFRKLSSRGKVQSKGKNKRDDIMYPVLN